VTVDFVRLASYGSSSETCGSIQMTKDLELPVRDRHVLVVEDIVDSGITLSWLLEKLKELQPKSVRTCVLINKLERRQVEVSLDYVCLPLARGFVVGYGLDFSEKHRNLPGIFEVEFDR
jgi:hypoxanthine phosphoribosyltransferase